VRVICEKYRLRREAKRLGTFYCPRNRYFSQITLTNRIYLFNSAEYLTASKTVACICIIFFSVLYVKAKPWFISFLNLFQNLYTGHFFEKIFPVFVDWANIPAIVEKLKNEELVKKYPFHQPIRRQHSDIRWNYINNMLIMNWSHSSYQCSANSDDSCNFVNELWDYIVLVSSVTQNRRHMNIFPIESNLQKKNFKWSNEKLEEEKILEKAT
jgi:hypothetical protein